MRIEWLNDDCTEAIVTRGRLWWKQQAHVRRLTDEQYFSTPGYERWIYLPSRNPAKGISEQLSREHVTEVERRKTEGDWVPVRGLPRATALTPRPSR